MPDYPTGRWNPPFCGTNRHCAPSAPRRMWPAPGKPRVRLRANKKYRDYVTIVSFKSKYIAVAVAAAIAVSLAVGGVMVYENRAQHAALLDTAAADARNRVLGELTLRAGELARHVSERVADGVLRNDRDLIKNEIETFTRDDTLLGVMLRDTAGNELYSWRRPGDNSGGITRSAIAPVRANVQTMPGIVTPQTVGEVEVEIRSLEGSPESVARANPFRFDAAQADAQGAAAGRCPRPRRAGGRSGARLVGRPPRAHAHHHAHQERRPHRARRLLAAAGSRAARRARRAAGGARAHAAEAAPDHHQQELPDQRARQHDRRRVRHLARRRDPHGQPVGLQAARLGRGRTGRPHHRVDLR